jgi:hypothetical protein
MFGPQIPQGGWVSKTCGGIAKKNKLCLEQTTYVMDKNCNVADVDPDDVCGSLDINFVVSPISLLLNGADELPMQATLTQFPLNPGKQGWYSWFASEEAPLLVYDPQHTGVITSASQLFGTYTFGGRSDTDYNPTAMTPGQTPNHEWRNGFEALARLDGNDDNRLTDEELEVLALWFDRNRNGVSEDGEVQALKHSEITALYFAPDHKDKYGNLYALRGFERRVRGRTVQGAMVDWYGTFYQSKMRAISETQRLNAPYSGPDAASLAAPPEREIDSADHATTSDQIHINGAWRWTVEEEFAADDRATAGIMILKAVPGGVVGHSFVELPIRENAAGHRSMVNVSSLFGKTSMRADGTVTFAFEALTNNKQSTLSDASIDPAGNVMRGMSRTEVGGREMTYRWVARRVSAR